MDRRHDGEAGPCPSDALARLNKPALVAPFLPTYMRCAKSAVVGDFRTHAVAAKVSRPEQALCQWQGVAARVVSRRDQ
jgi:hypothetical protein